MGKKLKLDEVGPKLRKLLDDAKLNAVVAIRDELIEQGPVETLRLASGWRIGIGAPNREVEPERDPKDGVGELIVDKPERIPFEVPTWISNNVEYAERVALDPSFPLKTAAKDWFTSTVNVRVDQILDREFAKQLRKF